MTGRALIIVSFFILAALAVGIVAGHTIGLQTGRAEVSAQLAPEIAENDAAIGVLAERLNILADQQQAFEVEMIGSWYGNEFHGRTTANMEIFDQHALTAAHKSLPFGTVLIIENPSTGRSVIATVTDRGPFIDGRDLDLSYGAAVRLGIVEPGVVPLRVRVIGGGE